MAEGDTIHRLARRFQAELVGKVVTFSAPHPRGQVTGVAGLDGLTLNRVEARGKHLLLDFGDAVLHTHLGMNGSWRFTEQGRAWPPGKQSPWAVIEADAISAAQFGGPTMRVLRPGQLRTDHMLARLGPDILAPPGSDSEVTHLIDSIRKADPRAEVGEVLLDQRLVAGIGNIFKSEGCFATRVNPWRSTGDFDDTNLSTLLQAIRLMMWACVEGDPRPRNVYRRSGMPCPRCGAPIQSRPQGDAARRTYWCPSCQV